MDNTDPCRMLDMYYTLNEKLIHEKGRAGSGKEKVERKKTKEREANIC